MGRADLKRLHWLREKRKEKALEKVAATQSALQRAENELDEARVAVAERIEAARRQDALRFAEMKDKTLSYSDMANFESDRGAYAYELMALRSLEKAADKRREEAKLELKAASAAFRKLHLESEKLQSLMTHQARIDQRKSLILSEAGDDEFFRPRSYSEPDGSQSI